MPDFRTVTQGEFFKFLRDDPRDIMPVNDDPYFTLWQTKQRVVIGKSTPGWGCHGEKSYMLVEPNIEGPPLTLAGGRLQVDGTMEE